MKTIKIILTAILSLLYVLGVNIGYTQHLNVYEHLMFPLCHANIFHLLCNLLALWAIRGKLYIVPAVIINFIASYIPTPIDMPTYGFSGVLFAIVGIKWGGYFTYQSELSICELDYDTLTKNVKTFFTFVFLPLCITVFLPNVNWCLHIYALIMGFVYGAFLQKRGGMYVKGV